MCCVATALLPACIESIVLTRGATSPAAHLVCFHHYLLKDQLIQPSSINNFLEDDSNKLLYLHFGVDTKIPR